MEQAEQLLQQANSVFVEDQVDKALDLYNQSLALNKSAEALVKRSICHYKLKHYAESIADANSALQLEPDNSKAFLRKGYFLSF
jgi:tetratricopeptide (TPR) repeat protein